jgi:hypothetical protein
MAEGDEGQFGGRVPKYSIGLIYGSRDRDVVLLDTKDGLVYWMGCPDKVLEVSFPQPSFLVHPLPDALEEHQYRTNRSTSRLRIPDMKYPRMEARMVLPLKKKSCQHPTTTMTTRMMAMTLPPSQTMQTR